MPLVRTRLLALVALLLVVVPLGAVARDLYFCKVMGRVMNGCCCAHAASEPAARAREEARLQRQDCCDRIDDSRASAPAVRDNALRLPIDVYATAATADPVLPERASTDVVNADAIQARAPPPTGPPLYLKNCAFLS